MLARSAFVAALLLVAAIDAACPSIDKIKDDCLLTTSTNCEDKCKATLALVNGAGASCVSSLLTAGEKYGATEELMCYWRTPCEIASIAGHCANEQPGRDKKATPKKTDFEMEIEGTSDHVTFFNDKTLVRELTQSIATTLNVSWANVAVKPATSSDGRRLASMQVDVEVYSTDATAAGAVAEAVKAPAFKSGLETRLASTTSMSAYATIKVETNSVQSGEARPTYTPRPYEPSAHVETLRSYSPTNTGDKWDPEDKEYQKNMGAVMVVSFVMGFLLIFLYWAFMCCHNVHVICKCCPCSNKKSWGSPRQGKIILVLMYIVVFVAAMSSWYGRNYFHQGVEDVAGALDKTAAIFTSLETSGNNFVTQTQEFENVAETADCSTPPYQGGSNSKDVLKESAAEFGKAAVEVNDIWGGLGEKTKKLSDDVSEGAPTIVDIGIGFLTGLFLVVSFLAIFGVLTGSRTLLGIANFLGVVVLIVMTIFISIELLLSVIFADFCDAGGGPNNNLVVLVNNSDMSADNRKLFTYYIKCEGGGASNPLLEPLSDAKDFTDILSMQTKGLADTVQCADPDMRKIYAPIRADGNPGIAKQVYTTLDDISVNIDCPSITPILEELTHDAICDSLVSGLYSLWQAQACASFFLLIALVYAAFVREHFRKSMCPMICGGDKVLRDADGNVIADGTDADGTTKVVPVETKVVPVDTGETFTQSQGDAGAAAAAVAADPNAQWSADPNAQWSADANADPNAQWSADAGAAAADPNAQWSADATAAAAADPNAQQQWPAEGGEAAAAAAAVAVAAEPSAAPAPAADQTTNDAAIAQAMAAEEQAAAAAAT